MMRANVIILIIVYTFYCIDDILEMVIQNVIDNILYYVSNISGNMAYYLKREFFIIFNFIFQYDNISSVL